MKTNNWSKYISIIILLTFSACNSDDSVSSDKENLIIIPGIGVAGLELGEYPEIVENKITAEYTIGSANGSRHWEIHAFEDDPYKGMQVWFINMDRQGLGPLDYIFIYAPFEGKTSEDIGIGSSISDVLNIWGQPDFESESSISIIHHYCFDKKQFRIVYRDNVIYQIMIGPFLPYWLDSDCFDIQDRMEPDIKMITFGNTLYEK